MSINYQLYNGNSEEVLKDIESESIDLVVTSPPYDNLRTYQNKESWNFGMFCNIANELARVIKGGA